MVLTASGAPAASWTGSLATIEYTTSTSANLNGDVLRIGYTGIAAANGTALEVTTAQTGATAYALKVSDDGTYTDSTPFIIDKDGGVNIGGNAALATTQGLQVTRNTGTAASAYIAQFYNTATTIVSTGGGVDIRLDATTGSAFPLMFSKSAGVAMQGIRCNYATNACAIATPSDERIKKNVTDTGYSLDNVLAIQVKDYEYTYDVEHNRQTGFIAQNLVSAFPDAVYVGNTSSTVDPSDLKNMWSVDYGRITPLLVKAIQDIAKITGTFKSNLITWLGDAQNGIEVLTAKIIRADKVETKQLCIEDVCITKEELIKLKSLQNTVPPPVNPEVIPPVSDPTPPLPNEEVPPIVEPDLIPQIQEPEINTDLVVVEPIVENNAEVVTP